MDERLGRKPQETKTENELVSRLLSLPLASSIREIFRKSPKNIDPPQHFPSICADCQRPFVVGDQVGKNGPRYFHLGDGPGGYFVGKIDKDGQFVPAFKTGENLAERVMRTGQQVSIDTNYSKPIE